MFSFDIFTNSIFSNIDNPFFTRAFYFASWLFNPIPFTVLLIASSFLIYKRWGKQESIFFLASSLFAFVIVWVLKLSFDTARPLQERIYAFGPSFPSGHTAVATAYFLSLLHFLRHTKDRLRRDVHIAFCILCPLFVGVSRLYFSVHWLSDVLMGYFIGGVAVYIAARVFLTHPHRLKS